MSVNKVILLGNVGRDPEVRTLPTGGKVANFSLATDERWRDRQTGEQRERTEWHRVVVFNPMMVDIVHDRVRKGTRLYLEGQLQTRRRQDPTGQDRFSTEIVLQRFGSRMLVLDTREHYEGGNSDHDYGGGGSSGGRRGQGEGSASYDDENIF